MGGVGIDAGGTGGAGGVGIDAGGTGGSGIDAGGEDAAGGTGGACEVGFGDCDGDPSNGCEASLNTSTDCGACRLGCFPCGANMRDACSFGVCVLSCPCLTGFADCDGVADNGCEKDLRVDPNNCGGCGYACGAGSCVNGGCQ